MQPQFTPSDRFSTTCRDCEQPIEMTKTHLGNWKPVEVGTDEYHDCHVRWERKFEEKVDDFTMQCFSCRWVGEPMLEWHFFANGVLHLSGVCLNCGKRMRSVPQIRAWIERAPPRPAE